jgi:DNA-directed RNA polymerase specialized sigma24 family protein
LPRNPATGTTTRVPGPSHEELFAALSRLRELSSEPADPAPSDRGQREWRVVERWLRTHHPRARETEDLHQETLFAIARHVSTLQAPHAGAAVQWITTIWRRKFIDLLRSEARSPTRLGLAHHVADDGTMPIDLVLRDESPSVDAHAVELLIETVEVAIGEHAESAYPNAADRQLRKLQGRAMLHRVLGADLDGIRRALALGPDIGDDRIYKWTERGRPVLLAALELLRQGASEDTLPLLTAMEDVATTRRLDAGRPRGPAAKGGLP